MQRQYHMLVVAMLISALCSLAQATPDKPQKRTTKGPQRNHHMSPMQLFKAADVDMDGKVSLEELHAKRPQFPEKRFQHLDKNKDGFLEVKELPTPGRGAGGNIFSRLDGNKDGKISFAEFKKRAPKMDEKRFTSLDKNGDGFVQREELPRRKPNHPKRSHGTRNRPESGAYLARLIEKNDTDGNKELSLEELQAAKPGFPESTFALLDRYKNGVLNSKDNTIRPGNKGSKAHPKKRSAGQERHQGRMRKGDSNQDGKLSFEEAQAIFPNMTREIFNRRDRNNDGFLSPQDRKAP